MGKDKYTPEEIEKTIRLKDLALRYPEVSIPAKPIPRFCDETLRSRRNLITISSLTIFLLLSGAFSYLEIWNVKFKDLPPTSVYLLLIIACLYEGGMFFTRAHDDKTRWKEADILFTLRGQGGDGVESFDTSLNNIITNLALISEQAINSKTSFPTSVPEVAHNNLLLKDLCMYLPKVLIGLRAYRSMKAETYLEHKRWVTIVEYWIPLAINLLALILLLIRLFNAYLPSCLQF